MGKLFSRQGEIPKIGVDTLGTFSHTVPITSERETMNKINPTNLEAAILLRVMERKLRATLAINGPKHNEFKVCKRLLRRVRRQRKTGNYHLNPIQFFYSHIGLPASPVDYHCRDAVKGNCIELAKRIVAIAGDVT